MDAYQSKNQITTAGSTCNAKKQLEYLTANSKYLTSLFTTV